MTDRQMPGYRDAAAAARDVAAAKRDADWPVDAVDHAAVDRLHAAEDRARARDDRDCAADDRDNLNLAVESRTTIGQAQGLLMARLGISVEDAFALLVTQSQHANVKLAEVAAGIVAEHQATIGAPDGIRR